MSRIFKSRSYIQKCFSLLTLPLVLLSGVPALAGAFDRDASKEIVTDRISGIAIMGYDPVAYFTNNEAVQGSPRFEAHWGGVIWRFANAANKAVFENAPQVYAPVHGGYDPTGMVKGQHIPGNPYIFAVQDHHVYLFVSTENRNRFLADKAQAVKQHQSENVAPVRQNISFYVSAVPAR